MEDDVVSMAEAGRLVHRTDNAIAKAMRAGAIIGIADSKAYRIDRASLMAWAAREADTLSAKDAAELVGCSPRAILDALKAGSLPGIPAAPGRPTAIARAAVLAWYATWPGRVQSAAQQRHGRTPEGCGRAPMAAVIGAVATLCMVPVIAIRSPGREAHVAMARQISMYALWKSGYNTDEIGAYLDRNPGTIRHGCSSVKARNEWRTIAEQCALTAAEEQAPTGDLGRLLTYTLRAYPPADARAVTAYVRGTLLCHTTAPGPLCAHGLWLLATQPRLYRTVVDRLTRSGYGADAGRIEGQMARLGYRRAS